MRGTRKTRFNQFRKDYFERLYGDSINRPNFMINVFFLMNYMQESVD